MSTVQHGQRGHDNGRLMGLLFSMGFTGKILGNFEYHLCIIQTLRPKSCQNGGGFFISQFQTVHTSLKKSKTSLAWSQTLVFGDVFFRHVMAFHHGAVQHLLQFIECHSATAVFVKDLEGRPAHTCCQVSAQK